MHAPAAADAPSRAERAGEAAWLALPVALVGFCAFRSGGFFPETPGLAAATLLVACALAVAAAPRAPGGLGRPLGVAAGALALLGAWQLASGLWSGAPGRAVLESDRTLLYVVVVVAMGARARGPYAAERLAKALGVAITGVCAAALASRLAPDVVPVPADIYPGRLSWPLTYWNALGLLAGMGATLALHVSACARRRAVAAVGAAALPLLAMTAVLTFSRASLAIGVVAAGAYLLAARPRGWLPAVVAALPSAGGAAACALAAGRLAGTDPTSAAAAAQGHRVAAALAALMALGAGARVLADPLAARAPRLPRPGRRGLAAAALAAVLLAAAGLAVAGRGGAGTAGASDARNHLVDPTSSGRSAYWHAAVDAWVHHPVAGVGAGGYTLWWAAHRPYPASVEHAHSLPLETLAELGLVGLALLAVALGAMLAGLWRLARESPAGGALLAVAGAWVAHACVDWDWQMPAVTIPVLAAGALALARPSRGAGGAARRLPLAARAAGGLALLVLALAPALVAISELRLRDAIAAYDRGDCAAGSDAAALARDALPLRAEPRALLGLCAARAGHTAAALADLRAAQRRDRRDWEWPYAQAVVLARAGRPPLAAARAASALNPRQPDLAPLLAGGPPGTQKRRAASARLFMLGLDVAPLG